MPETSTPRAQIEQGSLCTCKYTTIMTEKNNVPNFKQIANELRKNASRYAASEAIKFFKNSFVKGGFTDSSFQRWHQTNNPLAGKHTMYKSGKLMRSIKKRSETMAKVVVEADSDYAEIHNSGGTITVTAQMKKYFWAKYYEQAGKITTNKSVSVSLNKANRTLGAKAIFCRRIALMPIGSKIKIPKHQFMGHSDTLMKNFDGWFSDTVKTQVEEQFTKPTVNITLGNI